MSLRCVQSRLGYVIALGLVMLQSCSWPGSPPSLSDIARKEVAERDEWPIASLKVSKIIREGDHWAAIVWHVPPTPGDSRVVLISDKMKVIGYEGGE